MKKPCLLLVFVLFVSVKLFAQTERGKWMTGPLIHLAGDQYDTPDQSGSQQKITSEQVQISMSHFFKDNIAIGLLVHLQHQKGRVTYADPANNTTSEYTLYGIGPFIRYYRPLAKNFKCYADIALPFQFGKDKQTGNPDRDITGVTASAGPGLAYFMGKKFSLELNLGDISYSSYKRESDKTQRYDFSLFNPSYFVWGAKFHFGK